MKNIVLLIALFIFNNTMAQLPEANEIVLDAAEKMIGEKVWTGICFDLIDYSLRCVDSEWYKRSESKYVYGKKIKHKDILPGDIVVYTNCRFKDGGYTHGHVAIVEFVTDEDKNNIEVLEQNTMKSLKKSIVVISDVDLSENNLISGKLEFFRPY